MKPTMLFVAMIAALTLQQGRELNSEEIVRSAASVDTVSTNAISEKFSVSRIGAGLLEARADSGAAGNGVWFGTRMNEALYFFTEGDKARITIHPSGKVALGNSLAVNGTTTTKILTVIGGSDVAEPFPIAEGDPIPAGAVVVIDEQSAGKLKLCRKAYDTRVAGVVSGAGGLNPGLILQHEEKPAEGSVIALSGRVYVLATAANGAIKPGDLLTTSAISGHAMRATDRAASFGAILGKALTSLDSGEGLVVALVNLQ
ncbi:hypothetical protein HUU05_30415 [candidate division KSB1 bacterium]|nr:hypothetical protein [candidate division KSB1 bacterium]